MPKPRRGEPAAQPHDALVKWTFSQREHAIGLLRAALPPEVAAAVDWGTLQVEKGSFVDRALQGRHSDIVFSARMGEERVFFYTLVEHQRDVEDLMVFRILVYMTRLWERLVADHPRAKTLPPIVPLLLHHSTTGWTAATAFQDVVAVGAARAALERHIPRFEVRLIDLSGGRASNLVEQALTALGQVVMWCLSVAGDDERFEREIGDIAAALDEVLQAPDPLAALEAVLRYLAASHPRMDAQRVSRLFLSTVSSQAQEDIVTFLDEIELRGELRGEQRGVRRGKREGERNGRVQMLLAQLAARFGKVPASVKARVEAADDETLAQWALRVLTAPTLQDVLDVDAAPAARKRRATPPKRARRASAPSRRSG